MYKNLVNHKLDEKHNFSVGVLPSELHLTKNKFETLWEMHPQKYRELIILGRPIKAPRWEQEFGVDYHYSGRVNKALEVPPMLKTILDWAQKNIHHKLNGILLNWYDGNLNHYIGKHRDSITNLVQDAPIVTISFGEERTFRLRPWKKEGVLDFPTSEGSLFVMPYDTNRAWTHEVTRSKKQQGKRISITLRAFNAD